MSNPVAVISGGTKGLGRALSCSFGRAGFKIVALYSKDESAAQTLIDDLKLNGVEADAVQCDLSIPSQVDRFASDYRESFENSEITLIHNASPSFCPGSFSQIEWKEFQQLFDVNVGGFYQLCKFFVPLMVKKRGGTILSVLSSAVDGPPPKGFSSYVTAKSALQALTRSLAAEYARFGIKILSVSPGFMDTPLTQSWDPMLRDLILKSGSKMAAADDVAENILSRVKSASTPGQGETYAV